jgi:hypothetical protein
MEDDLAEKLRAALAVVRRAVAEIEALPGGAGRGGLSPGAIARELLLERREREERFPAGLFGEPGWELMLALYAASEEGHGLGMVEACEAARIGPAAARRLIARMEADGLVERDGGARGPLRLTASAAERMSDHLLGCFARRLSG